MAAHDALMTRMAQREVTRRFIDISRLDVRVNRGVVHIQGAIGKLHGHEVSLKHELEVIGKVLRGKPGIRDVIIDVEFTDGEL